MLQTPPRSKFAPRSERIRDKIAASKRKGLWVGGTLPLGCEMKDGKIAVVEEEAELVRSIFRRYLELGRVNELLRDLRERNIRTKLYYVPSNQPLLYRRGQIRERDPIRRAASYHRSVVREGFINEVRWDLVALDFA
jgi:Recombinase